MNNTSSRGPLFHNWPGLNQTCRGWLFLLENIVYCVYGCVICSVLTSIKTPVVAVYLY